MVAIRNSEAEDFIAKPSAQYFLFLLFGTDAGLIRERSIRIKNHTLGPGADAMQLVQLAGDQIASDPLLLLDEVNAGSLFGGQRCVIVSLGSKAIHTVVAQVTSAPPNGCTIILEAGALKRDAPLRVLVERSKAMAAVECLQDNAASISRIVRQQISEAGKSIEDDALEMLVPMLGSDRMLSRSETDKLLLYCDASPSITADDIADIVADASTVEIDRCVAAVFSGDLARADRLTTHVLTSASDPYLLLGPLLRYALALHKCLPEKSGSLSLDAAAQTMMRSGSYVSRDVLGDHLRRWNDIRLAHACHLIATGIKNARLQPATAAIAATRLVWTIARLANQRSR